MKDVEPFLHESFSSQVQTAFFDLNANLYHTFDESHYAFSLTRNHQKLIFLYCHPYNALIYGNCELAAEAATILASQKLKLGHILGEKSLVESFLSAYKKELLQGNFFLVHSMSIMVLEDFKASNVKDVACCTKADLNDLALLYNAFEREIFNKNRKLEELKNELKEKIHTFYVYKLDGKIVSIAAKARENASICAISHVFTLPSYRGQGYSTKVVSKICLDLLENKKLPYLYVDNENPISNHLYLKLGFRYLAPHVEYSWTLG